MEIPSSACGFALGGEPQRQKPQAANSFMGACNCVQLPLTWQPVSLYESERVRMSERMKFSIMMFLEFFIWGAWLPPIFDYLGVLEFSFLEQVLVLNAFAVASITGMFFSTQFADRNFAAEKFLAFSHLVGGVAILALGWVTTFPLFFTLILIHSLFYVPTISITNSIAFSNLPNATDDFPRERLRGTIGWIAASLPFVFILVDWSKPALSEAGSIVDWLSAALGLQNAQTGGRDL